MQELIEQTIQGLFVISEQLKPRTFEKLIELLDVNTIEHKYSLGGNSITESTRYAVNEIMRQIQEMEESLVANEFSEFFYTVEFHGKKRGLCLKIET
jgi:hypothetical protein